MTSRRTKPRSGPTLRKRVETYAGVSWVVGLVWWYLGGSSAIFRLLDATSPILGCIASACVVAVALTVAMRSEGFKRAAGDALFAGSGTAIVLSCAVPWFNVHLDGSAGHDAAFTVSAVRRPSKGPPSLDLTLADGRSINHPMVDGCEKGVAGVVTLHAGAFGLAWADEPRCSPAPP